MAILLSCCCCNLLIGSILSGVYTIVAYLVAFALSLWWLLDDDMYRSSISGGGRVPGYVLCGGHVLLVIASVILIYGLYKRLERIVICWIVLMVLVFFPEMGLVLFVNLYHRTVATPAGMVDLAFYIFRAAFNVVCILCVYSLHSTWKSSTGGSKPSGRFPPPYTPSMAASYKANMETDSYFNGSQYNGSKYNGSIYNGGSQYTNGHFNGMYTQQRPMNDFDVGYKSNGGFAASCDLEPSKIAPSYRYRSHSLPRSSSRASLNSRTGSVYESGVRLPAQFNAALFASATSLNAPAVPPPLAAYPPLHPYHFHHQNLYNHYASDYALAGAYATQSLDRRRYPRREEDCDALSIKGVGLGRSSGRGFILTPKGSHQSVGVESDDVKRFKDVAL